MTVDFLVQVDGFVVRKPVAFCEQHVGEGQVKAVEACASAGLATNSFFFYFLFVTPHRGNTILFRSSQQLPRLRLGPSKGFLS